MGNSQSSISIDTLFKRLGDVYKLAAPFAKKAKKVKEAIVTINSKFVSLLSSYILDHKDEYIVLVESTVNKHKAELVNIIKTNKKDLNPEQVNEVFENILRVIKGVNNVLKNEQIQEVVSKIAGAISNIVGSVLMVAIAGIPGVSAINAFDIKSMSGKMGEAAANALFKLNDTLGDATIKIVQLGVNTLLKDPEVLKFISNGVNELIDNTLDDFKKDFHFDLSIIGAYEFYGEECNIYGGNEYTKKMLIDDLIEQLSSLLKLSPVGTEEEKLKQIAQALPHEVKDHERSCRVIGNNINEIYGQDIIDVSLPSDKICKNVIDLLVSLSTPMCAEFLFIVDSLEKEIGKLRYHIKMLDMLEGKLEALVKDKTTLPVIKKAIVETRKQIEFNITVLLNLVNVSKTKGEDIRKISMGPMNKEDMDKLKKEFEDSTIGTNEYSKAIANVLKATHSTATTIKEIEKALKNVNISIDQYLKYKTTKEVFDDLMDKINVNAPDAEKAKYVAAVNILSTGLNSVKEAQSYIEITGGDEQSDDQDEIKNLAKGYAKQFVYLLSELPVALKDITNSFGKKVVYDNSIEDLINSIESFLVYINTKATANTNNAYDEFFDFDANNNMLFIRYINKVLSDVKLSKMESGFSNIVKLLNKIIVVLDGKNDQFNILRKNYNEKYGTEYSLQTADIEELNGMIAPLVLKINAKLQKIVIEIKVNKFIGDTINELMISSKYTFDCSKYNDMTTKYIAEKINEYTAELTFLNGVSSSADKYYKEHMKEILDKIKKEIFGDVKTEDMKVIEDDLARKTVATILNLKTTNFGMADQNETIQTGLITIDSINDMFTKNITTNYSALGYGIPAKRLNITKESVDGVINRLGDAVATINNGITFTRDETPHFNNKGTDTIDVELAGNAGNSDLILVKDLATAYAKQLGVVTLDDAKFNEFWLATERKMGKMVTTYDVALAEMDKLGVNTTHLKQLFESFTAVVNGTGTDDAAQDPDLKDLIAPVVDNTPIDLNNIEDIRLLYTILDKFEHAKFVNITTPNIGVVDYLTFLKPKIEDMINQLGSTKAGLIRSYVDSLRNSGFIKDLTYQKIAAIQSDVGVIADLSADELKTGKQLLEILKTCWATIQSIDLLNKNLINNLKQHPTVVFNDIEHIKFIKLDNIHATVEQTTAGKKFKDVMKEHLDNLRGSKELKKLFSGMFSKIYKNDKFDCFDKTGVTPSELYNDILILYATLRSLQAETKEYQRDYFKFILYVYFSDLELAIRNALESFKSSLQLVKDLYDVRLKSNMSLMIDYKKLQKQRVKLGGMDVVFNEEHVIKYAELILAIIWYIKFFNIVKDDFYTLKGYENIPEMELRNFLNPRLLVKFKDAFKILAKNNNNVESISHEDMISLIAILEKHCGSQSPINDLINDVSNAISIKNIVDKEKQEKIESMIEDYASLNDDELFVQREFKLLPSDKYTIPAIDKEKEEEIDNKKSFIYSATVLNAVKGIRERYMNNVSNITNPYESEAFKSMVWNIKEKSTPEEKLSEFKKAMVTLNYISSSSVSKTLIRKDLLPMLFLMANRILQIGTDPTEIVLKPELYINFTSSQFSINCEELISTFKNIQHMLRKIVTIDGLETNDIDIINYIIQIPDTYFDTLKKPMNNEAFLANVPDIKERIEEYVKNIKATTYFDKFRDEMSGKMYYPLYEKLSKLFKLHIDINLINQLKINLRWLNANKNNLIDAEVFDRLYQIRKLIGFDIAYPAIDQLGEANIERWKNASFTDDQLTAVKDVIGRDVSVNIAGTDVEDFVKTLQKYISNLELNLDKKLGYITEYNDLSTDYKEQLSLLLQYESSRLSTVLAWCNKIEEIKIQNVNVVNVDTQDMKLLEKYNEIISSIAKEFPYTGKYGKNKDTYGEINNQFALSAPIFNETSNLVHTFNEQKIDEIKLYLPLSHTFHLETPEAIIKIYNKYNKNSIDVNIPSMLNEAKMTQ